MKHIALLTTLLLSASLQAVEKPYDYVFFENSFRLPALSLLRPAIPWSLPMYPLPVEIGIARYNIARSVAMTSFVNPLRSLCKCG